MQQAALWALAIGFGLLIGVTVFSSGTLGWMVAAVVAWLTKTAIDVGMARRRRGP